MWDTSRGLRESVVHGLAKVGLVWALAVLGTLFVVTAAYGSGPGAYADAAGTSTPTAFAIDPVGSEPRTVGLALALLVLAAGIAVLAIGAAPNLGSRPSTTPAELFDEPDAPAPDPISQTEHPVDLSLARSDLAPRSDPTRTAQKYGGNRGSRPVHATHESSPASLGATPVEVSRRG